MGDETTYLEPEWGYLRLQANEPSWMIDTKKAITNTYLIPRLCGESNDVRYIISVSQVDQTSQAPTSSINIVSMLSAKVAHIVINIFKWRYVANPRYLKQNKVVVYGLWMFMAYVRKMASKNISRICWRNHNIHEPQQFLIDSLSIQWISVLGNKKKNIFSKSRTVHIYGFVWK